MSQSIYYDQLVGVSTALSASGWLTITVRNLVPGEYYVAPIHLWCPTDTTLTTKICAAGETSVYDLIVNYKVGPNNDASGSPQLTDKRYKLDSARHNGQATLLIGNDKEDTQFQIFADALTSKKLVQKERIEAGRCPECDEPGEWFSLAMVCKEHGVFL